jgi:hypothetical protein
MLAQRSAQWFQLYKGPRGRPAGSYTHLHACAACKHDVQTPPGQTMLVSCFFKMSSTICSANELHRGSGKNSSCCVLLLVLECDLAELWRVCNCAGVLTRSSSWRSSSFFVHALWPVSSCD